MTRDEIISSLLALDSVGLLDGVDLKKLSDSELNELHITVENYAHERMKAFMTEEQYSDYKEECQLYKMMSNPRN